MEGYKALPYIFLILALTGVIAGASVITLAKFGDTVTKCANSTFTWNSSDGMCRSTGNDTSSGYSFNFSSEYNTIYQAKQGELTVSEQLPTVAIIGIMVIIISIIAGVFVYLRYFA